MKINNKILLFLIIFIGILLFLTLDCFAADMIPDSFKNLSSEEKLVFLKSQDFYNKKDDNLKYIILDYSNYGVSLYLSDYPFKATSIDTQGYSFYANGTFVIYYFTYNGSEFVPGDTSLNGSSFSGRGEFNTSNYDLLFNNYYFINDPFDNFSLNHDVPYLNEDGIAFSREDCNDPFPPITLTLEEVLEKGYQTAQETTRQSMTAQIVEILPVGIAILATMIAVSLIAYFRFWRQ